MVEGSFDVCLVGPSDGVLLPETYSARYMSTVPDGQVLDLTSSRGSDEEKLMALTAVLPVLSLGLVVLPGWESDEFAAAAVACARLLNVDVFVAPQEGMGLGEPVTSSATSPAAFANPGDTQERPHEEAARLVLGDRGAFYDHPFDNFARTGFLWTGVLYSKLKPGEVVTPEDVALCMVGVKIAREAFRHKRDNLTDGHGYWMTHEMVIEERARRERGSDGPE